MNKKKWYFLSVLIMGVAVFTIFFNLKTEVKTVLKAEENKKNANYQTRVEESPPAITDQTVLSKYNLIKDFEGYTKSKDEPWSLNSTWNGTPSASLVKDERGNVLMYAYAESSRVEIRSNSGARDWSALVKTTISTIPGHYYQLSTTMRSSSEMGKEVIYALDWLSNSDVNNPVSVYSDYSELKKRPDNIGTTIRKTVKATTKEMTLVFSLSGLSGSKSVLDNWALSLVDLDQGIGESIKGLEALFTDTTHTELKLSSTQAEIDKVKESIETILNTTTKKELFTELAKAQALLDKITMSLTIPTELVNDPKNELSHTIKGKTYPNSFVHFSGSSAFPVGTLSSEVADDLKKYQIRADGEGNFSYSLPEGKYFKEDEKVTVTSMLRGKTTSQTREVKDLVPPEKPKLNTIKDQAGTISGAAEAGTTVTMYDKSDDTVFLTGTAGTDGQFSLVIPEAKKPLVPYKTYYVTATDAAGNVSDASDDQVVVDTTAPKAEAVKQALTLGDKLPAIDKMLTNISDNAGTADLTIKLTKTPDLSKTGYKTAEITLTDKAKNSLVVVVPITVKDKLTAMDSNNLLKADDFSALTIDLPETAAEQKAFILKHGAVEAWDLGKGELINDKLVYNQGSLKKEPGVYSITVTIGSLTRVFKVTLLEGSLAFDQTMDTLTFGTQTIASKEQFVPSEKKLSLSINDTRFNVDKWRLLAKVDQPLQTKDGLISASGLVYRSYETDEVVDTKLNELNTPMYEPSKLNNGLIQVDFTKEKNKEVVLNVLPGSVQSDKEYSTQIVWTLENGP
ncbi:hypothetical protein I583_01381 [Enterococcus haemoperoxidus ATCC BAA-382]|uniref:Bacterial Ig domain-containing protein n=5 Tax=Enterococcus haemoperoxidus TaxID=155618 RepID=A0ABN0LBH6_9ENTE|nr:Ig-like domain-containing protein [Enterococcus haemoperoxidus]EOT62381.1 hypothetical protein I583_01381 [Enterococcus haemoperoxidus ATCC BAA-382]